MPETCRRTCESYHRIDIRALARDGLLTGSGTITWSLGGSVTRTVAIKGDGDCLKLICVNEGQKIEERVALSTTPVHLGGHRFWFACPGCDHRVAILYGGQRFRCRHCLDLRYRSQWESARFRAISRIQKVRRKLGGDANLLKPRPSRPRYMHVRTFERLISEEAEAWEAYASTKSR